MLIDIACNSLLCVGLCERVSVSIASLILFFLSRSRCRSSFCPSPPQVDDLMKINQEQAYEIKELKSGGGGGGGASMSSQGLLRAGDAVGAQVELIRMDLNDARAEVN